MTLESIHPEKTAPANDVVDDEDDFYDEGDDEAEDEAPQAEEAPEPEPEPKPAPTTAPLHVVAELRAERNALREQNKQMLALLGQVQQRATSIPGATSDDLTPKQGESDGEFFGRVIQHLLNETQETRKEREQRIEREKQQTQEQQYVEKVQQDYKHFAQTVAPDLVEAGNFLAKPLVDHLSKVYPPEMIPVLIQGFERDLLDGAEKAGVGYGAYVWEKALAAGYVPQAERAKKEAVQQKRQKADASGRGLGGGSASAGGMTQMEAMKAYQAGGASRRQKIPELGMTVEEAFVTGDVRKLRK